MAQERDEVAHVEHLGCAVEFNSANDRFECPCHESGFAKGLPLGRFGLTDEVASVVPARTRL